MKSGVAVSPEKVSALIIENLPKDADANTIIFGSNGVMDSMGLVSFLADLEYRISEEFSRDVVLASERAMSRQRSPFCDVNALTDYIVELLSS